MKIEEYFRSLSTEFKGLKNRVRNFIEDNHWLTDGEWKESVLRTFLSNNLPSSLNVGRGFVLTEKGATNQIDIIIYKSSSPVFFREGDLVFLPPEAVLGVIEVKTNLTSSNYDETIDKLSSIGDKISKNTNDIDEDDCMKKGYFNIKFFLGLFSYDSNVPNNTLLNKLKESNSNTYQVINIICHGENNFIKYWDKDPSDSRITYNKWHSYNLKEMAYGYFIHNILLFLSPEVISPNEKLWFPTNNKEIKKDGEIESVHPREKFWAKFL